MKRRSIIAALASLLVATGVWGAGSAESRADESGESVRVTINYYTRPQEEGMEDAIIENFERQFPNIDVNRVEMPDDAELETLNTRLQAGDTSVDVFASDVIWPPIFIRAGWVIPITEYIDEAQIGRAHV
jgi:multiple sugar transport system substrate-binding protein